MLQCLWFYRYYYRQYLQYPPGSAIAISLAIDKRWDRKPQLFLSNNVLVINRVYKILAFNTVYPLSYLQIHPSRFRDPQLQVGENYSYVFNFETKHSINQ